MIYTVYEGREPVGEIHIEAVGLYYELRGKVTPCGKVMRLYGICGDDSVSMGIPDSHGELRRRISKKGFRMPDRVIRSSTSGKWHPWSGDMFGPMIYDALIAKAEKGYILAIPLGEWEEIPQWREMGKREMVEGRDMVCIDLGTEGQPTLKERENGGEENEVQQQNFSSDLDPLLLADLPADYDYGGSDTEEADCDHI